VSLKIRLVPLDRNRPRRCCAVAARACGDAFGDVHHAALGRTPDLGSAVATTSRQTQARGLDGVVGFRVVRPEAGALPLQNTDVAGVPRWFSRLMTPDTEGFEPIDLTVGGAHDQVIVQADPSDEIREVWQDVRDHADRRGAIPVRRWSHLSRGCDISSALGCSIKLGRPPPCIQNISITPVLGKDDKPRPLGVLERHRISRFRHQK
jgi:hypothetical protein